MAGYFDFHVHPTMKESLVKDKFKMDGWEDIPMSGIKVLGNVFESQAHFWKLKQGKINLACCALHAVERGFFENLVFGGLLTKLYGTVDQVKLDRVRNKEWSYYDSLEHDYEFLMKSNYSDDKTHHFNVVNKSGDIADDDLNIVFGVEGGHCFEPYRNVDAIPEQDSEITKDYVKRFQEFKRNKRIFYLTVTHLTPERTATHADGGRAMGGIIGGKHFKPIGKGLTMIGDALIRECYHPEEGYRTLVDVKHMSMSTRRDFYKLRQDNNWTSIPIVGTHMGVTGQPNNQLYVVMKNDWTSGDDHPSIPVRVYVLASKRWKNSDGHVIQTAFNPWSIGLYDEDISQILASGGMIGVSLDQRIIGYGEIFNEYFSADEFNDFIKPKLIAPTIDAIRRGQWMVGSRDTNIDVTPEIEDYAHAFAKYASKTAHIYYLANQILYIVRTGLTNGFTRVWEQICIGSDLDGLIDPINRTSPKSIKKNDQQSYMANDFERLDADLTLALDEMIKANKDFNYQLPAGGVEKATDMIMGENGLQFVKKWLTELE